MTIAFDIGGSKIVSAEVDASLQLEEKARIATPTEDYDSFRQAIAAHAGTGDDPVAISIAAVIDPVTGILRSANIPCISGRALAADLQQDLGRPVHVLNDAKAFVLSEAKVGLGRGHATVFGIILGTGIGGAVVLNGQLLIGATGSAGEWGHGPAAAVRSGADLPLVRCGCGQMQCVDALTGARGLENLHRHLSGASLDSVSLLQSWAQQDPAAAATMDVYLDVLGGALANAVNMFDPDIVLVGGGLSKADGLVPALDQELRKRVLNPRKEPLCIATEIGPEKGLIGATAHMREQLG
ncbi:N-acetylmannosamine kinase [Candidatus Rhodobacter oscarellae]|uniref:N-acetylglucosamine kinase n=1 Tax=Candidatus Rhodobacter oscarellae TaxID=1675527 RepID=A0A0J9EFM1_9RHOB|nr:ROK family protein [Candidatus Rhodobacter lobularis]KMW60479.1 N-acetylmannosamine kinase [Candidatus Rhodobacter lobularis]